jgi:cob(I)alamin adenosyltransferase
VGSHIATPRPTSAEHKIERTSFDDRYVMQLEECIDELTIHLSPLTNFILPNNKVHLARTACRMAETKVVKLYSCGLVEEVIVRYLNRLSDYLFTLGRYVTHHISPGKTGEVKYCKSKEK